MGSISIVYIGIGSNLGNREDNCLKAIESLEKNGLHISKRSSLYETEPWGVKEQPKFVNMAIEAETDLSPKDLLLLLKKIEKDMGRLPSMRWGPRIIDLDILLYDDLRINNTDLQIPHPLMHERDFVLKPLAEIAPEKVHPILSRKIGDLLRNSKP
jgi:2-amino-4-hydroxy-6-hydroxymethyldihydropteridine diphosphokinase